MESGGKVSRKDLPERRGGCSRICKKGGKMGKKEKKEKVVQGKAIQTANVI